MEFDNKNTPEDAEEGGEKVFDFWSEEGARHFNQIIEEGSAYVSANSHFAEGYDENLDDEECKHLDRELDNPDEETLPPGEMELIFENSFLM